MNLNLINKKYIYIFLIYILYISIYIVYRYEADGPQVELFLPCGQKLHNSRNSIKATLWRRLGPAQIRDKRSHIPHSLSQGDLANHTCTERLLEGQKWRGCHPIVSDVNLPIGLSPRIHLG